MSFFLWIAFGDIVCNAVFFESYNYGLFSDNN